MISQFLRNIPTVVKNLLIINIMMFIAKIMLIKNGIDFDELFSLYSFTSPLFQPYQIITHMFMHVDFGHLLFNMFALVMFGSVLERVWGAKRFLIFYLICGLGSAVLSSLVGYLDYAGIMEQISQVEIDRVNEIMSLKSYMDPDGVMVTVTERDLIHFYRSAAMGASGAIFGILVGFGVLFPNTELMLIFFPVPIKAKYFIPILMLAELSFGLAQFEGDNIAHWAHLGGGIIGFILLKIWQRDRNNFY